MVYQERITWATLIATVSHMAETSDERVAMSCMARHYRAAG